MLNFILVLFILSILFEIVFNILVPKDPEKLTVSDYWNMLNRDKTRNMKTRIPNPFSQLNIND